MPTKKKKLVPVLPDNKSCNSNKQNTDTMNICMSIRSRNEPHLRCLLRARDGEKYCPLHLSHKHIIEFIVPVNHIDEDINHNQNEINDSFAKSNSSVYREISLIKPIIQNINTQFNKNKNDKNNTIYEQKKSTLENTNKENEDDLEIKLLILVNDTHYDNIAELIGPVFNDITQSEDEYDPITYDKIWTYNQGVKIPASVNKYYLFSYQDSKNRVRCLTIFTIYDMIKNGNTVHPITMEPIPEKDIERANRLIDLYKTKIGLFKETSELSEEFKLKNRLTKLFKQFQIHNIYFEEKWLLDLDNIDAFYKIITETGKLVYNNIKNINPTMKEFKIFRERKKSVHFKTKNKSPNDKYSMGKEDKFDLQEYIVGEWEKLIEATNNPQNQLPIWIIALGLSNVIPEVKQKYPDLEMMLL